ncbi:hypothetical protein QVD17_00549 [Tagetes erecta]|uniref:Uncharacterized protein n=1 Tax=Tagetes erecta TaxID=13708 RepID=A0AAD8L3E8_TARER|nr:hypothetical protein QVD17_00549 [Tagetes erecta]
MHGRAVSAIIGVLVFVIGVFRYWDKRQKEVLEIKYIFYSAKCGQNHRRHGKGKAHSVHRATAEKSHG